MNYYLTPNSAGHNAARLFKNATGVFAATSEMRKSRSKHRLFSLMFLFCLFLAFRIQIFAASSVTIVDCRLLSSTSLQVTASVSNVKSLEADTCYLFALSPDSSSIPKNAAALASAAKAKTMTFSCTLSTAEMKSHLNDRFVIGAKNENAWTTLSQSRCLSNPSALAPYNYAFPTATSKKGLQVNHAMWEDAEELGVQHTVLNINMAEFIASPGEENTNSSYKYVYNGKTYWFRKGQIGVYDSQLINAKKTNMIVSAVLLLGWRNDLSYLIPASGRSAGHYYYSWDTSSKKSREMIGAAISFLAERYSSPNAPNGRIVNWIVGNEVNNLNVWNYCGNVSLAEYIKIYAGSFRLTYNIVSSVYANARVYISLDHLWNMTQSNGFTGRSILDGFAAAISRDGYIPWNIAYHAYGSPLTHAAFWENTNKMLTEALTTPVINIGNISLLTNYVKQTYGANTRIILSEQGYTSVENGQNKQKEQSAAIAYSYYVTESDDMIDSFIMNRQVDHQIEIAQGLNLGLWTTSGTEWAAKKKKAWNIFKFMDTTLSETYTTPLLPVIGAKSWKSLVDKFTTALYSKLHMTLGNVVPVGGYKKGAAISAKWQTYGATAGQKKVKNGWTVYHNGGRNANCLWGISQKFKKPLSFQKNPILYTTVQINGANAKKCTIKMRFYSGNAIYDCTGKISTGKPVMVGANLTGWVGRDKVEHIQILIVPYGTKGWQSSANATFIKTVRGK